MYIISFTDSMTGEVITRDADNLTEKNIRYAERNVGFIDYLYNEALKILSTKNVYKRYITYYKKKRNGKLRRIDIPDDELKSYMRKVNSTFTEALNFVFPECVSAYVKHRSVKQAAQKHAGAYAIMQFDIEDFFGSCTLKNIMDALSVIYPFCLIDTYKLTIILLPCMIFYDGQLR